MSDEFSYDVFISYNSSDKGRVLRLAMRLRDAGLRVWLDDWVIAPGADIFLEIERGLEASRVQLLCLSPAALASKWVTLERNTTMFRDPTNADRRFVPVLLADCELPQVLSRYKYLDFRKETRRAFNKLLEICRPVAKGEPSDQKPPSAKAAKPPKEPEPRAVAERSMKGHEGPVLSVAVSPDSKWTVSGGSDKTVRIWDLGTGECLAVLKGHKLEVQSVAITPDGKRIVSASSDKSVGVWDARARQAVAMLEGHTGPVTSVVALEKDRALSGGSDRTLNLWNLVSGRLLRTIQCGSDETDEVFATEVGREGKTALSGHRDGRVRLWNLADGEYQASLIAHWEIVRSVRATPDGRFAVSGSDDRTVKVWNLQDKTRVWTLEGHRGRVSSVAISRDGALAASAGFADGTVRLWDLTSGACLQVIPFPSVDGAPISLAFDPAANRLVIGTGAGDIHVYCLTQDVSAPPAEETRRYVNAKVVLMGEGMVGKTSLAHRLFADTYVERERTHGMNVFRLDLPLSQDTELEREALLWDLAGQEYSRLINRLFLDETALALLLVSPEKEDPLAEAGDWLRTLETSFDDQTKKRDVPRLLIFSQIDVAGMKIGKTKIERLVRQYGFDGWLATSAKTGENCSDKVTGGPSKLKRMIANHIPWDDLPRTATPRILGEMRDALLAMRDKADIRLLRLPELAQRLKQALPGTHFDESDLRTSVTLLANHGLAVPLRFGDLVLLRPDLLNGYAAAIIRAARDHPDEIGCVLEADIYRSDFDFTGVDRLRHRSDEELLLRALVQTFLDRSLCIAENTPLGKELVFPSQYRRETNISWEPDVFVSYTFSGEWQTVWSTLVVRLWYSQEFQHRELWRNAAEFQSSRGDLLGLKIDSHSGQGKATISVFFDVGTPDDLKVILIEYVHRHLAKYASDISRDRRYVCGKCGKRVTDLEAVRQRFEDGKDFIICQVCDKKVPLVDLIERQAKSSPVARQIVAMENTATRELDSQSKEQLLIGHMMAICGEASQIFRPVSLFDYGIDGEVEFKDEDGRASGKKIYVQLKSGNSYLRRRQRDGSEVFDVKNSRHLEYWISQPMDVYLVILQLDEKLRPKPIRWMNVTRYLKNRKDKDSRRIVFSGEELNMQAVWKVRQQFFPLRQKSVR